MREQTAYLSSLRYKHSSKSRLEHPVTSPNFAQILLTGLFLSAAIFSNVLGQTVQEGNAIPIEMSESLPEKLSATEEIGNNAVMDNSSTSDSPARECVSEFLGICLVRAPEQLQTSVFGFAEFVAALALLVVLYTISDVRFRFRVAVAPIPLFGMTFVSLGVLGFGTLLIDVWFAARWPLPDFLTSQPLWQGAFGAIFLILVLVWIFYAFILPPVFGSRNYKKFAQTLYRFIFRGSDQELPTIAAELARSAVPLITAAGRARKHTGPGGETSKRVPNVSEYAHDVLLLIGNRKFCRHVMASSPGTAVAFFTAMAEHQHYNAPMGQFATNIASEAILNKDSVLYHEDHGYNSGLIGYLKPFSKAVFGNYEIVEALSSGGSSPLDIDHNLSWNWDGPQFEAYIRVCLVTFESYLKTNWGQHSYALYRAMGNIKHSCLDTYKLNDMSDDFYSSTVYKRLSLATDFVKNAAELMEKHQPLRTKLRKSKTAQYQLGNFYDHIADLMFDLIFAATAVTAPPDKCWTVQHNTVWSSFLERLGDNETTWKILQLKLRRLLYDEIMRFEKYPNFKSAKVLGICLNVMGLTLRKKKEYGTEYYALHKPVLQWTRKNFMQLADNYPDVANACLMGGVSFDRGHCRLVKTYQKGLNKEVPKEYLELDPP